MQLTQKETSLLKDLKTQEQLCAEKYAKHAESARDEQLKTLFGNLSGVEKQHFEMLKQIEQGTVPQTGNGGNTSGPAFVAKYGISESEDKSNDCYLCNDLLAGEKQASGLYDTCIFEFADASLRNVLNAIQKDEQHHGKQIYDYMSLNNMKA